MQAEPNWTDMYEWARNMARNLTKNSQRKSIKNENTKKVLCDGREYWVDELASTAVCHFYEVWQKHSHLPHDQWKKYVGTILHHAMLASLKDDKAKGRRGAVPAKDPDLLTCDTTEHQTDDQAYENAVAPDDMLAIESQVDAETIVSEARKLASNAERAVMDAVFTEPDATAAEISALIGTISEGAVRIHKHNALRKVKSRFSKDINAIRP